MALKQILSYETSDGQVFEAEADALGHEEYLSNAKPIEVFIAESNVQRAHATYLRRMLPKYIAFLRTFDPAAYPDPVVAEPVAEEPPAGEFAAEAAEAASAQDMGLPADAAAAAEVAESATEEPKSRGRRSPKEYATHN